MKLLPDVLLALGVLALLGGVYLLFGLSGALLLLGASLVGLAVWIGI